MANPDLLSPIKEKQKPGPKAKEKVDVEALKAQVDALQNLIIEMGTHTGQANVIRSHGFPSFEYVYRNKYANK